MKKTLGKKNSIQDGTIMAFGCDCMSVCNIGCSCSGTTAFSTTSVQNLAKVVSTGMQYSTWSQY